MGAYGLRKFQIGLEATGAKGTAVSTSKILTGIDGQLEDTSDLYIAPLEYYTGLLPGSNQGTPVFVTDVAQSKITGDLTYENAAYLFNMFYQSTTGATAAAGQVFNFLPPTTSITTPRTVTIQTGDNTEQLKAAYGFGTDFEIKLKTNTVAKFSGTMVARSITSTTAGFDASTAIAATPIPTNPFKVYIDAATGTIGTTLIAATVREANIKVKNGFHQKTFFDGVLYPTSDGQNIPEVSVDFVLEYNSNAVNVRSDFKAKNQKRVRLSSGPNITALNSFWADFAGYWQKPKVISQEEGNTTIAITLMCAPAGTTTADYVSFNVINALTGGL